MKPIKTIAGEMLLYLYLLQRQNVVQLKSSRVNFGMWQARQNKDAGVVIEARTETIFGVVDLQDYSDTDIYNALLYLEESGLVDFKDSPDNTGSNFFNFRVSAAGVDIVEGIERGEKEKTIFNVTFNFDIDVHNDVTVESLLKTTLGSVFKASVL